MRPPRTARTTSRAIRRYVAISLAAATAVVGAFALQPSASTPLVSDVLGAATGQRGAPSDHGGEAVTEDDGVVPDGVTAFDEAYTGVANLDPDLLQALREATRDAAEEGITLYVNSGWRSPAYQEQLLREAIVEHGSEAEAARWAATPDTSAHVTGDAVDIGSYDAMAWLSERGSTYGLCQTYRNEPWHHELRPDAIGSRCPPPYPDPTHDPRLQP